MIRCGNRPEAVAPLLAAVGGGVGGGRGGGGGVVRYIVLFPASASADTDTVLGTRLCTPTHNITIQYGNQGIHTIQVQAE